MENASTSEDVDGRRHQWHLAFNALLLSARDVPEAMAQPVVAMREDVACVAAVLQGCKAALEAQQLPMTSELMLLKRLIHRNRSQHGNSMHLRRLIQLRIAAERVSSSGLSTLINYAVAATHEDTAGGSVRGNTMPSRQLLDLLLARLVVSAVLSQRAHRAARLAFRANEELIRHALFMPLAVTCLALSARLLRLTARYREALAESHLRLFAVRARAPINPQSAVHAPAAELMAHMLAQAQLPSAKCSPNFEGQVACLRQLLGDTVEARDGDASASHDEDAAAAVGSVERTGTRAHSQSQSQSWSHSHSAETPAAGKATEETPPGQACSSGAGSLAGLAHGEGRGKASAAEEDEGVSMQDLGVLVSGAPLSSQSSKLRPEKDDVVGMVEAARVGAKAPKTPKKNRSPHPAGTRDKSAPSAPIPAAVSEVASSHSLDGKKRKKQKAKIAEGKKGLSGSGAAALAALAAVAPPRASLDKISAACIESKEAKKKSEAKEHVSVRPGAPAAGGGGKRGISSDGLKGGGGKVGVREEGGRGSNTLMNMLLPSSAADGTDWDLWSGVQGAKRKRRDEDEAGEELSGGARSKEKKRVINQSAAAPGDEGKAAVKSHLAVGSVGPRDPKKKNSKEQKRMPKSASGIFSDLLPHGGWGD